MKTLDISQGLKTLIGGELKAYNEMMNEARTIATKRMVDEATSLETDAVVNIQYASSSIMQGAAEVIAYRTAVKLKYNSTGTYILGNHAEGVINFLYRLLSGTQMTAFICVLF